MILFLGANPSAATHRAVDHEIRAITASLRAALEGRALQLAGEWAVRAADLQGCLLEHRPEVVHFSGHGSEAGQQGLDHAVAEVLARAASFRSDRGTIGGACQPWHSPGVRWNDEKSRLFQALRAAEAQGTLTDPERAELSRLLEDLDADEADALRPALEQAAARAGALAAEKAQLEAQADALARIVAEHEELLADATTYLQKLREKSTALAEDYRRLMGYDLAPAR